MPSHASRSASVEPTEETDPREPSTSQSRSTASPAPNGVADKGKDDNPEDQEEKNHDDTDKPTPGGDNAYPTQGDWQAIWAPAQNAYYFYNTRTNETTWTNPLQPLPSTSSEASGAEASASTHTTSSSVHAAQTAAAAAGIDPSLAYLDPSLGLPGSSPAGTFTAKFNARTGAFARIDARDPSHLSESERAKRMSEVYFDVGAWEKELEQRNEEEAEGAGKKRKRPSKKDLVSTCKGNTAQVHF